MPTYLQRARTLANLSNYNAENVCRNSQAHLVEVDVERRAGDLHSNLKDYIKDKLVDRPSGFRPQDQSGFMSSVDKNKVIVENDTLRYTGLLTTDHAIANPWYGKQRQPKSHKTRSANCSSKERGRNWVSWVSEEEIADRDGLHLIQRYGDAEDMWLPLGTTNKPVVFKSSFTRQPYAPSPFHTKVDNSILIERSDYGERFLRDFQPLKEGPSKSKSKKKRK